MLNELTYKRGVTPEIHLVNHIANIETISATIDFSNHSPGIAKCPDNHRAVNGQRSSGRTTTALQDSIMIEGIDLFG